MKSGNNAIRIRTPFFAPLLGSCGEKGARDGSSICSSQGVNYGIEGYLSISAVSKTPIRRALCTFVTRSLTVDRLSSGAKVQRARTIGNPSWDGTRPGRSVERPLSAELPPHVLKFLFGHQILHAVVLSLSDPRVRKLLKGCRKTRKPLHF